MADWYKAMGFLTDEINYKEVECQTIAMGNDYAQQRGVFSACTNGKEAKYWYCIYFFHF
jgi:hypothetical protein